MPIKEIKSSRKITLFVVSLFWLSLYMHIPYQTIFLLSMGVSKSSVGFIIGTYGIAQVICRIPLGLMGDMGGKHKKFLILGPAMIFFAALSRIFAKTGTGYLIANLCSGVAAATWVSYMIYFMTFFEREEASKANGMIISFNQVGVLIAFSLGAFLYDSISLKGLSIISAFVAFAATVMAFKLKESVDINNGSIKRLETRQIFKSVIGRRLILFSLAAMCVQGVIAATAFSFTGQIAKEVGARGLQVGICSILYTFSSSAASFLTSTRFFSKRYNSINIVVSLAVILCYCLRVPNAGSLYEVYILQFIAGIACGLAYTYCTSEAIHDAEPRCRSTAMAIYQSIYAVGMTLLPMIAGRLAEAFTMKVAYYGMTIFCILAMAFVIIYRVGSHEGFKGKQTASNLLK